MKIVKTIKELQHSLTKERQNGKITGLTPTMGALHQGHLSLVRRCMEENDICVVSIFVNPTQFNDPKDLITYPRTLDKDCELLEKERCDIVFIPSVEEMYPEPDTRRFDFGAISQVMEGVFRPGHFTGVAQIVSKLFYTVAPDNAYFGEKDYQQIAVIRAMIKQLDINVNIVACPTFREPDGLAMSSRNARLTPEQRQKAPLIARALKESITFVPEKSVQDVKNLVASIINAEPLMRVEYYEIVNGNTLEAITGWNDSDSVIGCITVYCGDVRLIDNIRYR